MTNYHVIDGAYSAKIKFGDEEYKVERVLSYSKKYDLAILKITAPEGVELRTDMELICEYYKTIFDKDPWDTYRRAMISAYGESNIAIIGEEGSVIDGRDCFDPDGEEGFRGPHGIFMTNC